MSVNDRGVLYLYSCMSARETWLIINYDPASEIPEVLYLRRSTLPKGRRMVMSDLKR
jgi:hypothetical protein